MCQLLKHTIKENAKSSIDVTTKILQTKLTMIFFFFLNSIVTIGET